MHTITGAFNDSRDAELAIQALHEAGFGLENGPADDGGNEGDDAPRSDGPDATFDVSARPAASPGAEAAPQHAAAGAAVGGALGFVVGLGALPALGLVAPLAGAGVGAYGGSLFGALKGMKPAGSAARADATGEAPDYAALTRGEGGVIKLVTYEREGRARAVEILWACGAVTVVEGA